MDMMAQRTVDIHLYVALWRRHILLNNCRFDGVLEYLQIWEVRREINKNERKGVSEGSWFRLLPCR